MRGEYVASIFGSALANDRTDKNGADNVRILFHTHSCSVPQMPFASIISSVRTLNIYDLAASDIQAQGRSL